MKKILSDYPFTVGAIISIPIVSVILYIWFQRLNGLVGTFIVIIGFFIFETIKRRYKHGSGKDNQKNE